jgi:hypothetical protein
MSEPILDARAYAASPVPVRDDLRQSHREILEHIATPGSWFTGTERVAIAEESRAALRCRLCAERKQALSPEHVQGEHGRGSDLPELLVDTIHRIRTDSQRLSRAWFEGVRRAGVEEGPYVELVGVVTLLAGVDSFCRALGIAPFPLPRPRPGEPSRYRPDNLTAGVAWVPMLMPEDASGPEADLYGDVPMVPNIMRALSLVPDHVRMLIAESDTHYVAVGDIGNPAVRRNLDRQQIELVAARVSALNECFY